MFSAGTLSRAIPRASQTTAAAAFLPTKTCTSCGARPAFPARSPALSRLTCTFTRLSLIWKLGAVSRSGARTTAGVKRCDVLVATPPCLRLHLRLHLRLQLHLRLRLHLHLRLRLHLRLHLRLRLHRRLHLRLRLCLPLPLPRPRPMRLILWMPTPRLPF